MIDQDQRPDRSPRPFRTTLRTRGPEIDPQGFVRPALYLRYCEHVRWVALAASDEVEELFRDGAAMVIVAQKLAIARDVGFGVELAATFAVGRIGRTSLDFHQEISLVATGEPVAAARITAVYIGPGGRPAPVPQMLRRRQPRDHAPLALPLPESLPPDPPGASAGRDDAGGFALELTVRPSDADLLGHVNHAKHVDYLDDARLLGAAAGQRRLGGRLRGVAIDYQQEARPGERVRATAWPLDGREGQVGCALLRTSDDEPLTRARLLLARSGPSR